MILQAVGSDDAPLRRPLGPIASSIAGRELVSSCSFVDAARDIAITEDFDRRRALAASSV
ncbi:hypothetical protein [Methylorubrum thiocyanatum]